jgi:hypothetical protein
MTYDIYIFIWLYSYNVVDVSSVVDDSYIAITSIVDVDVPALLEDSTGL